MPKIVLDLNTWQLASQTWLFHCYKSCNVCINNNLRIHTSMQTTAFTHTIKPTAWYSMVLLREFTHTHTQPPMCRNILSCCSTRMHIPWYVLTLYPNCSSGMSGMVCVYKMVCIQMTSCVAVCIWASFKLLLSSWAYSHIVVPAWTNWHKYYDCIIMSSSAM